MSKQCKNSKDAAGKFSRTSVHSSTEAPFSFHPCYWLSVSYRLWTNSVGFLHSSLWAWAAQHQAGFFINFSLRFSPVSVRFLHCLCVHPEDGDDISLWKDFLWRPEHYNLHLLYSSKHIQLTVKIGNFSYYTLKTVLPSHLNMLMHVKWIY